MKRRDFIGSSVLAGGSLALFKKPKMGMDPGHDVLAEESAPRSSSGPGLPDLQPARWIWYPSGRTLPNTFVLFRREIAVPARIKRAAGWIAADSRYLLEINGRRIQWGPAPADPRGRKPIAWLDRPPSPAGISSGARSFLRPRRRNSPSENRFCSGWKWNMMTAASKSCFDSSWTCCLSRAWKPGRYKIGIFAPFRKSLTPASPLRMDSADLKPGLTGHDLKALRTGRLSRRLS